MKTFQRLQVGKAAAVCWAMACAILMLSASARAAVSTVMTKSDELFVVASTDLLQTDLGSVDSSGLDYVYDLNNLYDGLFYSNALEVTYIRLGTNIFHLNTNSCPR